MVQSIEDIGGLNDEELQKGYLAAGIQFGRSAICLGLKESARFKSYVDMLVNFEKVRYDRGHKTISLNAFMDIAKMTKAGHKDLITELLNGKFPQKQYAKIFRETYLVKNNSVKNFEAQKLALMYSY